MRRIVGLILVIALTILATFAESFRNALWTSYRDYASPYLAELPIGSTLTPASSRVVLVLVRGLRLESSRQMTALNDLRGRGADIIVQQTAPTYRLPAWVTLLSGATAETHGVTTNYAPRAASPQSIFSAAQIAGAASALVGSQLLGDTFGDAVQRFELIETPEAAQRDDDAVRVALDVLRDPANPMRLVCVELTAIEEAAGDAAMNGGAGSDGVSVDAAGNPALIVTDARIKTLVDALDLNTNTVVILADRGLTQRGNDGGAETEVAQVPMIMAGMGVTPGGPFMIKATDVAPTLAALIGTPLPVDAQGQPALSVLALPASVAAQSILTPTETVSDTQPVEVLTPLPALLWTSASQLTTFYENWSEAVKQPRFAAELLRAYQDGIKAGDANTYLKFTLDLNARANNAYAARLDAERTQRLPLVIGAALLMVALLGLIFSARAWQSLVGTVLYVVAWHAVFFFLREHRFSLSMFANGDPAVFLSGIARDSAVLLIAISVLVAVTTGKHEDGLDAIATVLNTVLLIVCVQAVQAVWFYFQWGNAYTWNLPESSALVATLVALTQASALSWRIVPELPNLPMPLVFAFITLAIFSLVRKRDQQIRYGRLR